MPNPLGGIVPIINLLGNELKVLPATGGAVEDLQHPDQEEIEDTVINKDVTTVNAFAETPEPIPPNIYRPTPPLSRSERPYYRFFIDGSIRTYFLGTGIEGRRSFPIELAQIGATVVERDGDGKIGIHSHLQQILLLLPKQNQGISDTVWDRIQRMNTPDYLRIVDFTLPDRLGDARNDPRDKAGAKARSEMHKLEIELINSTNEFRCEDKWLVLDGSVMFVEEDLWDLWKKMGRPYVIGLAKSFKKDPVFQFGRRSSERKDITSILAGLPHAHRTSAFSAYDGKIAFWYVRLREQKELDYPLMGVVKVELPCPDRKPVDAELADLISRALVAERNVSPYGLDRRWHCSLYPIYITEQVIKNKFFSREVLMGCIKWPRPQIGGLA